VKTLAKPNRLSTKRNSQASLDRDSTNLTE
jgi:hypothetical protein